MPFVKVTGTKFVRDTNSMAIMPIDNTEKNEYLIKVRAAISQKEEINKVKSELDGIKSDISDIKILLQQLLIKG